MAIFIIGLGRFGSALAKALSEKGVEVIAIDKDEAKISEVEEFVTKVYAMDVTNEKVLSSIGIEDADTAVVCITNEIEASILACMILKEKGVKKVMAKAGSELHKRILQKIGVDRVIFPEQEMAYRVAQSIVSPYIFEIINLSEEYKILERIAPKFMENKKIKETKLKTDYGVHILAIKRNKPVVKENGKTSIEEELIVAPGGEEEILKGDLLVLIGKKENIEKFRNI